MRLSIPHRLLLIWVLIRYDATRRYATVECARQIAILPWPEGLTIAFELRVTAENPIASEDLQRLRAIIETCAVKIADCIAADGEGATLKVTPLKEYGTCRRPVRSCVSLSTAVIRSRASIADAAQRRDSTIEIAIQLTVLTRAQGDALSLKVSVDARFPSAVAYDDGRRTIVKAGPVKVRDVIVCDKSLTLHIRPLVQLYFVPDGERRGASDQ